MDGTPFSFTHPLWTAPEEGENSLLAIPEDCAVTNFGMNSAGKLGEAHEKEVSTPRSGRLCRRSCVRCAEIVRRGVRCQ